MINNYEESKNYLLSSCFKNIVEYTPPVNVAGFQIFYSSIVMLFVLQEVIHERDSLVASRSLKKALSQLRKPNTNY